jgi:hypothetical protein
MMDGTLAGWQWRWLFQELPLIRAHSRWDTQTPMPVEVCPPTWLPVVRVHIEPRLRDPREVLFTQIEPQEAGFLDPGQREAIFETSVMIGRFVRGKWRWTGDLRVPVQAVASPQDAFVPSQSHDLDTVVATALRLRVRQPGSNAGTADAYIKLGVDRSADPRLAGLAFGLVLDVIREDRVMRSIRMPASSFRPEAVPSSYSGFSWPHPRDWGVPSEEELAKWRFRIRGDRTEAISSWSHDAYWAGEINLPLAPYFIAD